VTARELPAKRTLVSPVEVYMALRLQLEAQLGKEQTTRAGAMILLGQMALETGRFEATMNYNFGGVKCSASWKGCWQHFTTTEHVEEDVARTYLTTPPPGSKVERVGVDDKGRVILRFSGRHPVNKFRAFETLDDAMQHHVAFLLGKRYRNAVHLAMAGRADDYAVALRSAGYYTGDAATYARNVRLLAREYDGKMPPEPVPAPTRPADELVSVAATLPTSEPQTPAVAPPTPKDEAPAPVVVVPPVVPLPQVGTGLTREEPRPWWVRLLVWLVGAMTGRFTRRP
jgi:Mannosyl-glycoprotein endo-beta-N-acetylglucosaminidase